ncbi:uncharacterized protein LOC135492472 [Lineus longissimus]|uniref:uncharacterized protein LOC135492472 n=1 Tax=Lineus longissimus TaxID=88925 RepID=UPI00315D6D2C
MEGMEGGDTLDRKQADTEDVKSEANCTNNDQKTEKGAWHHCKNMKKETVNGNDMGVGIFVEIKVEERPILCQDDGGGDSSPDSDMAPASTDGMPTDDHDDGCECDGDVEMMNFEECPQLSHPYQKDNQNSPNSYSEADMRVVSEVECYAESDTGTRRMIYVDEAAASPDLPVTPADFTTGLSCNDAGKPRDATGSGSEEDVMAESPKPGNDIEKTAHFDQDGVVLNDATKETVAIPQERNAVYSLTESNIVSIPFGLPIRVSELVVTSLNFPAEGLAASDDRLDLEPEDSEVGPRGAKVPRLQTSHDNLDDNIGMKTSSLPSAIDMAQSCSEKVTSSSPVISDMEIKKNLMTVLSPSQSPSIGSLSTQISPSTCSLDCSRDSMEDTECEDILCYPTFEELQQSYNLDSSEAITVLSEAILKNAVLSQQVVEKDENQDIQPGLPLKIINCQVQRGNPAFTTPHRPWSTNMAPPQNITQQPSGGPPRQVHFVNLPRRTVGGNVVLPAKGTPHPAQGVYMPGQGPCHHLGFPEFRHRTPTGYIIRQAAPNQKTLGVSPHASPANISLNSSGEENSNTSPEEGTPPPHVPYNTPQSGIVNNPRFPLCNRLIKDSNILAQLEATVKNRVQSSPKNLEGFAEFRSPFPAEAVASDGIVHTAPDQGLCTEQDLAFGRDHHNAKERRRRLRIKDASNKLKKIVPGLTSKTDKATVFEYAVEYILYMKQIVGSKYDRQFITQCSPY